MTRAACVLARPNNCFVGRGGGNLGAFFALENWDRELGLGRSPHFGLYNWPRVIGYIWDWELGLDPQSEIVRARLQERGEQYTYE